MKFYFRDITLAGQAALASSTVAKIGKRCVNRLIVKISCPTALRRATARRRCFDFCREAVIKACSPQLEIYSTPEKSMTRGLQQHQQRGALSGGHNHNPTLGVARNRSQPYIRAMPPRSGRRRNQDPRPMKKSENFSSRALIQWREP